MAKFFSLEGPFYKYGTLLFDIIMLSAVWACLGGMLPVMLLMSTGILGSVPPVVGIIMIYICMLHWLPASTAVCYALGKKQRGTDTYTMRDFWHSYSGNYKQCMILSLIVTTVLALILYNAYLVFLNQKVFGTMTYILLPLECLLGVLILFIMTVLPDLIARFDMKVKDFLRYSLILANKHLLTTILLIALLAGSIYLCLFVNMGLLFVIPGLYLYFSAALWERCFRNYMPSEDDELEEEEIEGFSLDAERQAIIDRYLNQTKYDTEGEYRYVKVDEQGNEIVEEDNYHIVLANDPAEEKKGIPAPETESAEAEESGSEESSEEGETAEELPEGNEEEELPPEGADWLL